MYRIKYKRYDKSAGMSYPEYQIIFDEKRALYLLPSMSTGPIGSVSYHSKWSGDEIEYNNMKANKERHYKNIFDIIFEDMEYVEWA